MWLGHMELEVSMNSLYEEQKQLLSGLETSKKGLVALRTHVKVGIFPLSPPIMLSMRLGTSQVGRCSIKLSKQL